MNKLSKLAISGAVALAFSAPASALNINFDTTSTGTYSSLTISTVTFTFMAGNGNFQVVGASPGAPISGNALISYFDNPGAGNFRATIAGGTNSFKIGMGDFAPSDDDDGWLRAYDSGNNLLATSNFYQPSGHPGGGGYLSVSSGTSIAYVEFQEVGSFAGAVYWDDVTVGAIPEPETYAMLLAGLGLMGFAARRRKQKLAAA